MPKVVVAPGRIEVREAMSPYDDFVRRFLTTMQDVEGVLVSGYAALVLGRTRNTEDIDMLLQPHAEATFRSWWGRLRAAGFHCLQTKSAEVAYQDYLSNQIALRFADEPGDEPNMEVKFVRDTMGRRALQEAWALDLLGVPGRIGDLSDQLAYKLYLGSDKDLEDAEHIALVAGDAIDWSRVSATALNLEVPSEEVERLHRHAQDHR